MIWVTGCTGMLGSDLCRRLCESKLDFVASDSRVDVVDYSALESFADGKDIDFIVNCAAYTAVDKAESEEGRASAINSLGPENLARLAKKIGAKLLHVSTDYVFDGSGDTPFTEDMAVAPLGVYGKTKADGEKRVAEIFPDYYILRTAWLYGWNGRNFVYTMIRAMNSRGSVKVVDDQHGTPTFCGTLSNVIISIIRRASSNPVPYGIYHVTDEGETTWFGFTQEIKRQSASIGLLQNEDCRVEPCSTEDYPTPAKRPAYSVLSKKKIQDALQESLPDWKDSLSVFLKSEFFDTDRIK